MCIMSWAAVEGMFQENNPEDVRVMSPELSQQTYYSLLGTGGMEFEDMAIY